LPRAASREPRSRRTRHDYAALNPSITLAALRFETG
jgi:hypothetical protein